MGDLLKVYVPFASGETPPAICRALEHQGRVWLAPRWTVLRDKRATMPKYLIPLDLFQHKRGGPGGVDYIIDVGIPAELFAEEIPVRLRSKFQIVERPNILFASNEKRISS